METKNLDKAIVAFIEENSLAIVTAFIVVTLVQLLWWMLKAPKSVLSQEGFHKLPLIMKQDVNHNTRFFRFGFEDKKQQLGLPIGQHLVFRAVTQEGEPPVSRPYTPVSDGATKGHVDFVIKVYPQGVMSQYLDKLKIGQTLAMKGPRGKFTYKRNMKKSIGAAGFFVEVIECGWQGC